MKKEHFEGQKKIDIEIKCDKNTSEKIRQWKQENRFFGVFPVVGDSMENSLIKEQIPNGSKILVYDLELDLKGGLWSAYKGLPTGKPLMIKVIGTNGKDVCLCKIIEEINFTHNAIKLGSYNQNYTSKWLKFEKVKAIFQIYEVLE